MEELVQAIRVGIKAEIKEAVREEVRPIIKEEIKNELGNKLDTITNDITNMKSDIDTMKSDIDTMKSDIDNIKGTLILLEQEHGRKIDAIYDLVNLDREINKPKFDEINKTSKKADYNALCILNHENRISNLEESNS